MYSTLLTTEQGSERVGPTSCGLPSWAMLFESLGQKRKFFGVRWFNPSIRNAFRRL